MSLPICPKCQYQRLHSDTHVHAQICPRCGVVYARHGQPAAVPRNLPELEQEPAPERQSLIDWATEPPERVDSVAFYARALCAGGIALWTVYFISGGIDWEVLGGSFMHSINLAFHEFGHVFFRPFGEFMTILGGSLFQVLWPGALLAAFLFKYRDTFAASLMLWWSGQSLLDLSPYIADAYARGLPLVGDASEEAHDWGNLLTMTDMMNSHMAIARTSFLVGSVIMLLALVWMGRVLWRQHEVMTP